MMLEDSNKFSQFIEETAVAQKKTTLEVLVEYVMNNDIDDEKLKKLVSRSLQEKLEKNFIDLGLLSPPKNSLTNFYE